MFAARRRFKQIYADISLQSTILLLTFPASFDLGLCRALFIVTILVPDSISNLSLSLSLS